MLDDTDIGTDIIIYLISSRHMSNMMVARSSPQLRLCETFTIIAFRIDFILRSVLVHK